MSLAPKDFVSLGRRFERADVSDTTEYWSEVLKDRDSPRDWAWLRARSRAVALLAQAGSGKTVEFMHQVDQKRAAGGEAFFFRVERLCTGPLVDAHETPECRLRFERWIRSRSEAEIFLDAVDEAKLPQSRTARPLRDALMKLRSAVEPQLGRISLFVSCRSSEWFDEIEQRALEEFAQAMTPPGPTAETVSVFNATFQPLSRAMVLSLAKAKDAVEAMEIMIDSEAITDIVTPLDAIMHLETFLEFKSTPDLSARFGSRGRLLETSVRRRLAEHGGDVRRSHLDLGAALRAAQFLAFASVTAETMDLSQGGPRKDCIDPEELLVSGHAALSRDGARQLLACALFVPSGQARVRFYRREARDMLAAQWLFNQIREGGSALAISDRFIRTPFSTPRVPAVYGSMLAWLAAYDPVVCRRMIETAPEWVIEDGDPRSLALEDRLAALHQHVRLGPHRFHGEFHFDVGELRRFARPELEHEIVSLLAALPDGDLLADLMQFAEAGRFASAAPHLVGILNDHTRSSGDRMLAVRALIACGSREQLREVVDHLLETGGPKVSDELFSKSRNDHFLLDLISATYPAVVSAREALALCAQLAGKEYSPFAKSFAASLSESAPSCDLEQWLVGLDRLCFPPAEADYRPFTYDTPRLDLRATILLRPLLEVAARYLLEAPHLDMERDLGIYDRIRRADNFGASHSMSRRGSPVRAALSGNAAFRHALYERLARVENHKHTAWAYHEHLDWSVHWGRALDEDFRHLLARYRSSDGESGRDYARSAGTLAQHAALRRRLNFHLAIILAAAHRWPPDWRMLKEALVDPPLRPWRRYRARREWRPPDGKGALRALVARGTAAVRKRLTICRRWNALREGSEADVLIPLVIEDANGPPTEADMIQRHGRRLGDLLVSGAAAFARTYRPIDRHGRVRGSDLLAQAGYVFAWHADTTMTGFDPARALEAALLFANDWPDWATELAIRHSSAWTELVSPLLAREAAAACDADELRYSRFLSTVAYLPEEVRAPLAAPLFAAVSSKEVIDGPEIDKIVRILKTDPHVERKLPEWAERHARRAWSDGDQKRALNWLPVWAEAHDDGLETLLDWVNERPEIVPDGLHIYARLCGRQSDRSLPPLSIRTRFANLAYSHVRPEDDPPPREGLHDVTSREDLQHLRSEVGELIAGAFDAAERDAVERLLDKWISPISAEWAERWRNRYEQQAAKPKRWSQEEIMQAGDDLAGAPRTGDELHKRIGSIIAELEQELARSEFDRRGLFPQAIHESDFRAWLGHALDGRRRSWFSIVQEAETSDAKRSDLRIELRSDGSSVVVIEIKLLHRWTCEDLLDKFQSQLIDQYLLEPRVHHGIYLIVDLGGKPIKQMPDGSEPDSDALAGLLNAQAAAMAADGPVATAQVFRIAPSKRHRASPTKRRRSAPRSKARGGRTASPG